MLRSGNEFRLPGNIGCALAPYAEKKETAILKNHWEDRLNRGEIRWTAAASFFMSRENWQKMQQTVTMVRDDIAQSGAERILTPADLHEDQEALRYLMTIEGMCGIDKDPEERIDWLYEMGNRIGSLCWNDEKAHGNSISEGNQSGKKHCQFQAVFN